MVTVIGLKKCRKCGFKEPYGCLRYYTIGAPFICPQCNTTMDHVPYWGAKESDVISTSLFIKIRDYFKANIDSIDYKVKYLDDKEGTMEIIWVGTEELNKLW